MRAHLERLWVIKPLVLASVLALWTDISLLLHSEILPAACGVASRLNQILQTSTYSILGIVTLM